MNDAKTSAENSATHPSPAVSKQLRAQTTRQLLVDAAREIFARDGFELARLEDIAAAAGRTRGAFYAHFQDKEDLFFAIFEQDKQRDQDQLRKSLAAEASREARIDILVKHLAALLKNRRRILLSLEFKMYAIRHPHKQKRLADLVATMCQRVAETGIDCLLPELRELDRGIKRTQAAQFGALIDGLALNHFFDPLALDSVMVERKLRDGIASILG